MIFADNYSKGGFMLISYNDCISQYGNDYKLNKAVAAGELFKVKSGIYSTKKTFSELEIVAFRYPNAVFTMNSAFYYHSLTDVIPDGYHLATEKDAAKIKDKSIKQYFVRKERFDIGVTTKKYNGVDINVYDLERMLIELIRNKNKLPFDYYKEIIENYRNRVYDLDTQKLQEYIKHFPKSQAIFESIQLEVM